MLARLLVLKKSEVSLTVSEILPCCDLRSTRLHRVCFFYFSDCYVAHTLLGTVLQGVVGKRWTVGWHATIFTGVAAASV